MCFALFPSVTQYIISSGKQLYRRALFFLLSDKYILKDRLKYGI